ncbi:MULTISPECIES: transcriptional regulator LldR [Pantoea]|jgi:GntR family L-lactate dehydrogenase operon transcriptional regulator|uniref:Transcriptional regulator n=1 Tax=Pantoea dispersa TaxID=59814 RepID=A0A8E1RX77_9GAMM|nr:MULTISPECIES: transcriptional regulator LldR [Pantoea]KAA6104320.1 transcriptional regulator LldR [Pantoea sp. B_9]KAA6112784.1 transcriptional regulator LldR [Pantoea sp. B_10]KTR91621.1 transcriptional regulator [Pantoea dispersa]KTS21822.1 transcriptional regulator [Pantoea dispersa]KTS61728.1 transcriptional regulator [Pantoea dispersa]
MTEPTPRLADTLRARLSAWIEEHQLKPGMRLPSERALAARFGASRSSVREAIQQLISSGVLISKRGGGTWLCEPQEPWSEQRIVEPIRQLLAADPDYRWDILEARHAIEASTAWHAAQRATEADKERLRYAFDALIQMNDCDDPELAAQADLRFHLAIAEASHNLVLLQTMRGFFDLLQSSVLHSRQRMYTQPVIFNQLNAQHQAMFDAVMAGDADAARQAAMDHLGFVHTTMKTLHEDEARQARITRLPGATQVTRKEDN